MADKLSILSLCIVNLRLQVVTNFSHNYYKGHTYKLHEPASKSDSNVIGVSASTTKIIAECRSERESALIDNVM